MRRIEPPSPDAPCPQQGLQSEAEQMKFVLQKEQQEAERKRIEAQGIADFQRIVAQGISAQLLESSVNAENRLQSVSRTLECLDKLLERINAGVERLHLDPPGVEQLDRARERTAAGADHGDLVDNQACQ
jgi:hypothetical protein